MYGCTLHVQLCHVKLFSSLGVSEANVNAGKQLAVRPVLDATNADTHGWSLGASDGDHNVRLDAMDEGLTRLVASLPSDNAESQGNRLTNRKFWGKNDTRC